MTTRYRRYPKEVRSQAEWDAFVRWQESYDIDIHGYVQNDEFLSLKAFREGGLRGHTAPICEQCTKVENEQATPSLE